MNERLCSILYCALAKSFFTVRQEDASQAELRKRLQKKLFFRNRVLPPRDEYLAQPGLKSLHL
jgi:hypothetical protein